MSAKRKVELLLSLIKGRKLVDVCREHDLKQSEVESWMKAFMRTAERGQKAKADDENAVHEKEVKDLRTKVGELVLELDARKEQLSTAGTRRPSTLQSEMRSEGKRGVDREGVPMVMIVPRSVPRWKEM